eukprot:3941512-Rhodomonas_salina.2
MQPCFPAAERQHPHCQAPSQRGSTPISLCSRYAVSGTDIARRSARPRWRTDRALSVCAYDALCAVRY